jgi:L-aspartate oxidase
METDVLIIGCGIAGASAALQLAADRERRITVLTRAGELEDSNSTWAQGGIVSVGRDDNADLLVEDVIAAGSGLCLETAVKILAEEGPRLLREILIDRCGVQFDVDAAGEWVFGLEGAHSRKRILHVGDATGQAIMAALLEAIRQQPNIELLTGQTAIDLLTFPHHASDPLSVYDPPACHGVYAFDQASREVRPIIAEDTVLAAGGLGQIYLHTTNPRGARGDGVAMAYRAGARVVNAEYVQFHPTALHMPGTTKMLISEAVRGEGAVLLTPDGKPFMERYEPVQRDLAARDIVARAIYTEMLANGHPYVLLDIASNRSPEFIRERFPAIHQSCLAQNIDITRQPIPIMPAAHYACGGVLVDAWGRATLPGLFAVGEVACTGVHGANRLASTSLLEGLVWGVRAAQCIQGESRLRAARESDVPAWDNSDLSHEADPALIQGDMHSIRSLMWHYVGLIRNGYRLERALQELRRLWFNIEGFYREAYLTDDLIGLRNMVLSAVIVARAASQNRASRGCHFREDSRPPRGAAPPNEVNELEPPQA